MPPLSQDNVQNRILKALSPDDFARMSDHLHPVDLILHQVLIEPHQPIDTLLFPEQGFVSVTMGNGRPIEVGLIGLEGFVGATVLLGTGSGPQRYMVQAGGHGYALSTAVFPALRRDLPSLFEVGLLFVSTMLIQTAETAFANGVQNIEPRLARWLLMCQDRLRSDELAVTHEYLAMMLGVQRSSVTLALQMLEGHGLIRSQRGRIIVRDRAGLIALADAGYGAPETEYQRLIGAPSQPRAEATVDA